MAKSIMQDKPSRPGFWRRMFPRRVKADPIAQLIQRRTGEVQRGEYDPIGTVHSILAGGGPIIFPPPKERRPALARFHSDSQIDLIDPWEYSTRLPTWYEPTEQQCLECRVSCEACHVAHLANLAEKDFLLPALLPRTVPFEPHPVTLGRSLIINGEKKFFVSGEQPCMHGHFLEVCGGTGRIGDNPCPTCKGTGKVVCERCGGTGLMSTGRTAEGKLCPACGGTQRVRTEHKQPVENFVNKSLELADYLPIGPIISIMIIAPSKFTEIWLGKPDDAGQYPHIVIPRNGRRAVILGGVLRKETTRVLPPPGKDFRK